MYFEYIPFSTVTGIFWDYENVSLRHVDYVPFLQGLSTFVRSNEVLYAKVYARKKTMSAHDKALIASLKFFQFKWVKSDDPNAADSSLFQSCLDVLDQIPDINHVLLLSGDGDFLELTKQLHEWDVRITLICQQQNYNVDLARDVHKAYSVSYVAQNPHSWWFG